MSSFNILTTFMLNVVMLSVMLFVAAPSVIMLNGVRLSVMTPHLTCLGLESGTYKYAKQVSVLSLTNHCVM
jgi:hypothetical protein